MYKVIAAIASIVISLSVLGCVDVKPVVNPNVNANGAASLGGNKPTSQTTANNVGGNVGGDINNFNMSGSAWGIICFVAAGAIVRELMNRRKLGKLDDTSKAVTAAISELPHKATKDELLLRIKNKVPDRKYFDEVLKSRGHYSRVGGPLAEDLCQVCTRPLNKRTEHADCQQVTRT